MLHLIGYQFEVILLIETHVIRDKQIFHLDGYDSFYNEGLYNKCDGIMAFVKETVPVKFSCKFIGNVKCVELVIGEQSDLFLITCIYRSPAIQENLSVENLTKYLGTNTLKNI